LEYKLKDERELDPIKEPAQRYHVLSKYLLNKDLTLRIYPFNQKFKIVKIKDDASQIAVHTDSFGEYPIGSIMKFYSILAKYIELDCTVIKIQDSSNIILKVDYLGISKKERNNERIPGAGLVHISNIVTVKTVIDSNMFQMPTLVKVAFDEYRSKLTPDKFETIKIDIFKPDLLRKFSIVKKSKKIFFLPGTQDAKSYQPANQDYLNFTEDLDDDIELEKKRYRDDRIVSECIVPVLYGESTDEKIPIGYVHIQNQEYHLTEEDINYLKNLSEDMVKRIIESNSMQITGKFTVIDISQNGLQVKIDDSDLIKILPKQKSFLCDIIFKMQAPFTVIGKIRWYAKKPHEDSLLIGIELEGKSDLPGERMKYIKNLEELKIAQEMEMPELNGT
jgi:hypothetical protein